MTPPGASLRTDLVRIDEALEPFGAPVTDERPGLRWMREVLEQRRDHVREQLRQAETSRLEVEVTSADGTLLTGALATMLDAVQELVRAAVPDDDVPDHAVTLTVSSLRSLRVGEAAEPAWLLTFERLPGPFATQAVSAAGELVVDAAFVGAVRAVQGGEAPDKIRSALNGLVRTHALALRLRAVPTGSEPVEALLDQQAATR